MNDDELSTLLLEGLAGGVQPSQVEGMEQAVQILPILPLVRSLFSSASPADAALKLVVLLALARSEGRFSRERIRSIVRSVAADRLDDIVTSLYRGGWLELRASDGTYRLNPLGRYLLGVLLAANSPPTCWCGRPRRWPSATAWTTAGPPPRT